MRKKNIDENEIKQKRMMDSESLAIVGQSISMALENIRTNKLRSFLTMLGIMIGVSSVIGLVTIVQGVTGSVMKDFEGLGANTISLSANGTALQSGLSLDNIETLRKIDGIKAISISNSTTANAVYDKSVKKNVSVQGKDTVYFKNAGDILLSGRTFNENETDGETRVAVVNKDFVKNVLKGNGAIGTKFILNGYEYTLIGVYKDSDALSYTMMDAYGSSGTVIVPYQNVLKMTNSSKVSELSVYYDEATGSAVVQDRLRAQLNKIYNNAQNSFSIYSMDSLSQIMAATQGTLSMMLGGIASISLLVGGIGIMNMMLVSVSERTKEIGLRKSIGAEPGRIQAQFLIESITLSICGGSIGIVVGLAIAFIASRIMKIPFDISYTAIIVGACFSTAVGIIFGWMPAKKASELNPIDALRSE